MVPTRNTEDATLYDAVSYIFSLTTSIVTILRIRMDMRCYTTAFNPRSETSVATVAERYGRLCTAIMFAFVEFLACCNFATVYKLQGGRKHLLPIIRHRMYELCSYAYPRIECFLDQALQSHSVGDISAIAPLLSGLKHDLQCHQPDVESMLNIPQALVIDVAYSIGETLDCISYRAQDSLVVWLIYTPLSVWFGVLLCYVSVPLAFISSYLLCDLHVSKETSQPLIVIESASEADISMEETSASRKEMYKSAHMQCSLMTNNISLADSGLRDSPSLDLSVILADPRADVSSLMLLQMLPLLPEIHVTLADQVAGPLTSLESFLDPAERSISMDLEIEAVTQSASRDNGVASALLPTAPSAPSFSGLSLMLLSLENSSVDEIGCPDYSWEDSSFMLKREDSLLGLMTRLEVGLESSSEANVPAQDVEILCPVAERTGEFNGDIVCTGDRANGLLLIQDDPAVRKPFPSSSTGLLNAPWNSEIIGGKEVGTAHADVQENALDSQVKSLELAEAVVTTSTPLLNGIGTNDGQTIFGVGEVVQTQVSNAESILTHAEIEFVAAMLVTLDIEAVHDMCGTLFDDILFPEESPSKAVSPESSSTPPPSASSHYFAHSQGPHMAPTGSKLYSIAQRPTPEVVLGRDDALWRAAPARSDHRADRLQSSKQTHPLFGASFHAQQRVTEGAENRPMPDFWAPGRAGAIPIVPPPPSRRRRIERSEERVTRAKAAAERRTEWVARRALL